MAHSNSEYKERGQGKTLRRQKNYIHELEQLKRNTKVSRPLHADIDAWDVSDATAVSQ